MHVLRLVCRLICLIAALTAAPSPAGELAVLLSDGVRVEIDRLAWTAGGGRVDLHRMTAGIAVVRHVSGDEIRAVHHDRQEYRGSTLRALFSTAGEIDGRSRPAAGLLRTGTGASRSHELLVEHANLLEGGPRFQQAVLQDPFVRPPGAARPVPAPLPYDEPQIELTPLPAPSGGSPLAQPLPLVRPAIPIEIPGLNGHCVPPRWLDARVIGVRDDPLGAYLGTLEQAYPFGVPLNETGFALQLMRAQKAQEVLGGVGFPPLPAAPPHGPVGPPVPLPPVPGLPLQRFEAAAFATNAGGKADWDSVVVELHGFDVLDRPAPLRGTLRITLRGQPAELARVYGEHFIAVPGRIETVATWHRTIGTVPPGTAAPVRLVLPLPEPLPDHDPHRFPLGAISVQLLAPGQGVFQATVPQVLLAQTSPLRELNRIESGSRFFADEPTTGRRYVGGLLFRRPARSGLDSRILSVTP